MTDHLTKKKSVRKQLKPSKFQAGQTAERRRKQQRLSQRAYRARKVDEISNLQNRFNKLEAFIEKTSEAVSNLCDTLLSSKVVSQYPQVLPALHSVTESVITLVRATEQDFIADETSQVPEVFVGAKPIISESENEEPWWIGVFSNFLVRNIGHSTSFLRNGEPELSRSDIPPLQATAALPSADSRESFFINERFNTSISVSISFPGLLSTYLSRGQLSNFSQYLILACWNNGYRLLTSASSTADDIKQVFGSYLKASDRDRIACDIRDVLYSKEEEMTQLRGHVLVNLGPEWSESRVSEKASRYRRQLSGDLEREKLLGAFDIQQMLWERGFAVDKWVVSAHIQNLSGSMAFDIMSFITFLSGAPICAGNEPVFPRYWVEKALNLAMKDLTV